MDRQDGIEDLIERVGQAATGEKTSLREVVEALGQRSLSAYLLVPSLAVLSPLSGVPLFSTVCGVAIFLISAQMLMRRDHLWLPDMLMRRKVPSKRLEAAVRWMRGPARFLDRITARRLEFLVRRPFVWVTQAVCLIGGLVMPVLELVPFTSSILGGMVSLLALGMLARDGLFAILGFLMIGGLYSGLTTLLH
ncbi:MULTISPECIES: exopolysaccharide biosynthesis protein [unclassified Paracoccus (in: a-proteobacteria)]|uniref:exopolysaccharide biosynthesis protein n=1 Tax=unclassified Paracoccus (in: a-proteobacteria) TaxID=2688777 RepID=UPI001C08431A|nr:MULTISPECIES: exopolysaccharide biosynthesis protein [unclassified Paracoccus (in: a-proteobacteria)]MBU2957340.1 exopolysaccharide biosynthesis protein [Paracoccus sp. C2R09]